MRRHRFPARLAAALLALGPGPLAAADWYTGAEPPRPEESWVVAVDSAVDVTSVGSAFGAVSVTAAPQGGPAVDGVRLRAEGVAGTYRYNSGTTRVTGEQQEGSALAGYELVWRNAALAGFVGLTVRDNALSILDPNNPVVGTRAGGKVAASFYATPSAGTFVSAYGSYATTFNAYWARARAGYMVAPGIYVGPEALLLGDDFFRQRRFGVHVTGLSFGLVSLSAAVGYVEDRVQGSGYYTTVEARARF